MITIASLKSELALAEVELKAANIANNIYCKTLQESKLSFPRRGQPPQGLRIVLSAAMKKVNALRAELNKITDIDYLVKKSVNGYVLDEDELAIMRAARTKN